MFSLHGLTRLAGKHSHRGRRTRIIGNTPVVFETMESRILLSGAIIAAVSAPAAPQMFTSFQSLPAQQAPLNIPQTPPVMHAACDDTPDPTDPGTDPSSDPSSDPSTDPPMDPSTDPSTQPSTDPSPTPSTQPSTEPSTQPSTQPSTGPSTQPSTPPSTEPSTPPEFWPDFPGEPDVGITVGQTTTTLTASASHIIAGDYLTLTAVVDYSTSNGEVPEGIVTFYDGSHGLGGGDLAGDQTATLTTTALGPGVHNITATFLAANDFDGSTSSAVQVTVMEQSITDGQLYIRQLYRDLLHRDVDPVGAAAWTADLQSGATFDDVAAAITGSREYEGNLVDSFYMTYLGRHAEAAGLNAWVNQMQSGLNAEQIRAAILGSDEFFARVGGTNAAYVTALYQDFLGRSPDPTGFAAWTNQLDDGLHTRVDISSGISNSAENRTDVITGFYQDFLHRAPDAGGLAHWNELLAAGISQSQIVTAFVTAPEYLMIHGIA